MDGYTHDNRERDLALPDGWHLIERFDAPTMTVLEFQRCGQFGPRITAVGGSFAEAMAYGRDRMLLSDERDRQRGLI